MPSTFKCFIDIERNIEQVTVFKTLHTSCKKNKLWIIKRIRKGPGGQETWALVLALTLNYYVTVGRFFLLYGPQFSHG